MISSVPIGDIKSTAATASLEFPHTVVFNIRAPISNDLVSYAKLKTQCGSCRSKMSVCRKYELPQTGKPYDYEAETVLYNYNRNLC